MYLLTYDIQSNSLRAKLAEMLIAYGFERLQKSVFLGDVSFDSLPTSTKILAELQHNHDSIVMIKIPVQAIRKLKYYGILAIDLDLLCGDRRSLIL